ADLDVLERLEHVERALQLTQMSMAKSEGAQTGLVQQVQALSQALTHNQNTAASSLRQLVDTHMQRQLQEGRESRQELQQQFGLIQQSLAQQLQRMHADSQHTAEQLRGTLHERLSAIQADNASKLEEMRRTVDEKLHATLEQRLGESFKLVSDRLEQVHKGLGEMQSLASSVGDLKRVMTNVKTRGTWGEVQLGAIIDNVLTPDQYARNVKTVPGSAD